MLVRYTSSTTPYTVISSIPTSMPGTALYAACGTHGSVAKSRHLASPCAPTSSTLPPPARCILVR